MGILAHDKKADFPSVRCQAVVEGDRISGTPRHGFAFPENPRRPERAPPSRRTRLTASESACVKLREDTFFRRKPSASGTVTEASTWTESRPMRPGSQAAVRPERQSAWRCFRFPPAGHPVRLPDPVRSLPSAASLPGFLPGCRRKGSLRREYRPEAGLLFAETGNGIYGYCGTILFLRSYGRFLSECERRGMEDGRFSS